MNLTDTIHEVFNVGSRDCPTIEDAIPADREKLRIAALLEDPDTIYDSLLDRDQIATNMALAAFIETGAYAPLAERRRDLLTEGTACVDDAVNQRIELLWLRAVDDQRYGEPADFDERRAMA